jgi:hypothetical protein
MAGNKPNEMAQSLDVVLDGIAEKYGVSDPALRSRIIKEFKAAIARVLLPETKHSGGRPNTSRKNYEELRRHDFSSARRDDPAAIKICAKFIAACAGLKKMGVVLTEDDQRALRVAYARVQANTRLKNKLKQQPVTQEA